MDRGERHAPFDESATAARRATKAMPSATSLSATNAANVAPATVVATDRCGLVKIASATSAAPASGAPAT